MHPAKQAFTTLPWPNSTNWQGATEIFPDLLPSANVGLEIDADSGDS